MTEQFKHALLPETTHDELARQHFVMSLKSHIMGKIAPGNKAVYDRVAKPEFEAKYQRSPETRYEVREVMDKQPYYRWWGALQRMQQEMMWASVASSVDRQHTQLGDRTQTLDKSVGSLTLDPELPIPAYQTAVDIHCMPGGYGGEATEDENDMAAGAIYDRGTYLYGRGWLGPLNDDVGASMVENYLKANYPDFQPRKILDLGCSVGHSTLPYADGYPDAEVWAIDLSAPMLRYAHARAQALGKPVHFAQRNAERTQFPDASFDLVVSHILLHEIPVCAIRNVLRESYRLLAPGGIVIHAEALLYKHLDVFREFLYDWQTANNNEPFWSGMRDLDLRQELIDAGFHAEGAIETFVPNGVWKSKMTNSDRKAGLNQRGTWFAVCGRK